MMKKLPNADELGFAPTLDVFATQVVPARQQFNGGENVAKFGLQEFAIGRPSVRMTRFIAMAQDFPDDLLCFAKLLQEQSQSLGLSV